MPKGLDLSDTPTPTRRPTRSVTRCSVRANLGDLGRHFPDTDDAYHGVSSRWLLEATVALVRAEDLHKSSPPTSPSSPSVRRSPPTCPSMSAELSTMAGTTVSVKATTFEGLGAIGRGEGILASAIVLLSHES